MDSCQQHAGMTKGINRKVFLNFLEYIGTVAGPEKAENAEKYFTGFPSSDH